MKAELDRPRASGRTYCDTIGCFSRQSPAFSRLYGVIRRASDRRAACRVGLTREGLLLAGGWRWTGEDSAADDPHGAAQEDHHGHECESLLFGGRRHGRKIVPRPAGAITLSAWISSNVDSASRAC
jgi:hypothetical protein